MKNWNSAAETTSPENSINKATQFAFFLILFYLFLEYGRPQALVPPLRFLRLSSLVGILLLYSLFTKAKLTFRDKQTKYFVLLLGLMVIHGPFAVNTYWAFTIFTAMIYNFITFLSLLYFVDSEERFRKLADAWILIHVMVAFVGFIFKGHGAGGFLGDENDLCLTLNMALPFPFFLAMVSKKSSRKLYYFALCTLFLFAIIVTESRGGFLGLVATGAYCWWKSDKKFVSAIAVVLLVLLGMAFAPASYRDEIISIFHENKEENPGGTGEARIFKWRLAWVVFLDNPVIGVGQGNFRWNSARYQDKVGLFDGRSMAGREAHSLYFTLLPELGMVGTFIYALMIFCLVRDARHVQRSALKRQGTSAGGLPYENMAMAIEASLIGYLVSGAFISVLYYPNSWVLMGFALSLRKISDRNQSESVAAEPEKRPTTEWRPLQAGKRKPVSIDGGEPEHDISVQPDQGAIE